MEANYPCIKSPLLGPLERKIPPFCLLLAGSLWLKTTDEAISRNSPRHRGGPL